MFKYAVLIPILAIIVAIVVVLAYLWKKKQTRLLFIPSIQHLKAIGIKNSPINQFSPLKIISFLVFGAALILLILLVARPQEPLPSADEKEGIDIVFAVDISGSMSSSDVAPNRMEASQAVIKDFVARLKDDRVGLIAFSGIPITLCPLTYDYEIMDEYLKFIAPDKAFYLYGGGNTAVGDAILVASTKFPETPKDRTKVIVLITDGSSNTGMSPYEAAEIAKDKNVKLYTIFIGKPTNTSLAEKMLKEVAETTGGKSYSVTNQSFLSQTIRDIESLERSPLQVKAAVQYRDVPNTLIYVITILWPAILILPRIKSDI